MMNTLAAAGKRGFYIIALLYTSNSGNPVNSFFVVDNRLTRLEATLSPNNAGEGVNNVHPFRLHRQLAIGNQKSTIL